MKEKSILTLLNPAEASLRFWTTRIEEKGASVKRISDLASAFPLTLLGDRIKGVEVVPQALTPYEQLLREDWEGSVKIEAICDFDGVVAEIWDPFWNWLKDARAGRARFSDFKPRMGIGLENLLAIRNLARATDHTVILTNRRMVEQVPRMFQFKSERGIACVPLIDRESISVLQKLGQGKLEVWPNAGFLSLNHRVSELVSQADITYVFGSNVFDAARFDHLLSLTPPEEREKLILCHTGRLLL